MRTIKHINADGTITVQKVITRSALNRIGTIDRSGIAAPKTLGGDKSIRITRPWLARGADRLPTAQITPAAGRTTKPGANNTGSKAAVAASVPAQALNISRSGWPPEAVAAWNAWGSKNPSLFFRIWSELAPNALNLGGPQP